MNDLLRVIYVSKLSSQELSSDDIMNILTAAQKNNTAAKVSGFLIFNYGYFLQVLEGPAVEVMHIYEKIKRDKRHHDVRVLESRVVIQRVFPQWRMGFARGDNADASLANINAVQALQLLQQRAGLNNEAQP